MSSWRGENGVPLSRNARVAGISGSVMRGRKSVDERVKRCRTRRAGLRATGVYRPKDARNVGKNQRQPHVKPWLDGRFDSRNDKNGNCVTGQGKQPPISSKPLSRLGLRCAIIASAAKGSGSTAV